MHLKKIYKIENLDRSSFLYQWCSAKDFYYRIFHHLSANLRKHENLYYCYYYNHYHYHYYYYHYYYYYVYYSSISMKGLRWNIVKSKQNTHTCRYARTHAKHTYTYAHTQSPRPPPTHAHTPQKKEHMKIDSKRAVNTLIFSSHATNVVTPHDLKI